MDDLLLLVLFINSDKKISKHCYYKVWKINGYLRQLFATTNKTFVMSETVAVVVHCNDVIMSAMTSQITSVSIIHSTTCSGADQRKH